ncbi:polysaccharide deacetylase family protein [Candidatus Woesearchaeota archaeon]|nr:polysaccharide deacetylase family protein [Candidatus Woesearchaeota archaeon]
MKTALIIVIFAIFLLFFISLRTPETVVLSFDTELVDKNDSVIQILDILKENNIKATFFVMGQYAEQYPEIVKRMNSEDHEVACHTYSHPRMLDLSDEEKLIEIKKCVNIIKDVTGEKPIGFRAPYHIIYKRTQKILLEQGFVYDSSYIQNLGFLFPSPIMKELRISSFGIIPFSDVAWLHYLKMPRAFFYLAKNKREKKIICDFHPHHIIKQKNELKKMIEHFKQKGAKFKRCRDLVN